MKAITQRLGRVPYLSAPKVPSLTSAAITPRHQHWAIVQHIGSVDGWMLVNSNYISACG
jgi:hypothetical protein